MRKIQYAALATLALLAFAACVQEELPGNDNEIAIGENDLAFVMTSAPVTRAAEEAGVTVNHYTFKGLPGGKVLSLEETVSSMDGLVQDGPSTRGTPAYTENVASLYGAFNFVAYPKAAIGSTTLPVIGDGEATASTRDDQTVWVRKFAADPWGGQDELFFFMRMPGTQTGVSEYVYAYEDGAGSVSFDYTSPAKAVNQQDILFSGRSITKAECAPSGVPVFFNHALTGVKFRMGNELSLKEDGTVDPDKTRTYITKVELIGLRNSGTCTVTPQSGAQSSQSAVVWSFDTDDTRSTADYPIYQTFEDDDLVDFSQGEKKFPDSFYDAASTDGKTGPDKNLNDENASMTFWLIPQTIDEDVTVRVTVKVVSGADTNDGNICTLDLGSRLNGTEWKAGQMRTFTIKPDVVGIKITDELSENSTVKENVVIKNLGNVQEYVRVNILGNWVGKVRTGPNEGDVEDEYTVLMGYPDDEKDTYGNYTNTTQVATWNDKDFTWDGTDKVYHIDAYPGYSGYGTFYGLPPMGTTSAPGADIGTGWIRHDKYYYYTEPIGPGDATDPETTLLFTKYVVGPSPVFYIADAAGVRRAAEEVHLQMDVIVQAIRVPYDADGNPTDYETAWKAELGAANLNDL